MYLEYPTRSQGVVSLNPIFDLDFFLSLILYLASHLDPVHTNLFSNENGALLLRFKKICVHTYRFCIVLSCPHYNDHQERSHMEPFVRHFGYSRSSGLAPDRVYLDDITVLR